MKPEKFNNRNPKARVKPKRLSVEPHELLHDMVDHNNIATGKFARNEAGEYFFVAFRVSYQPLEREWDSPEQFIAAYQQIEKLLWEK